MENKYEIKFRITSVELNEIEDWLKSDKLNSKKGNSFYNNWDLICKAHRENTIAIIKLENIIIGYSIWSVIEIGAIIDIFEIKPDYRKRGVGKYFFKKISDNFILNNFKVIRLFCEPKKSEIFWIKMGFRKFSYVSESIPDLSYFKPLIVINEPKINTDSCNKLELWDLEPHLAKKTKPKWIWDIDYDNFQPILHPCNSDWNIRLSIKEKIIKEKKVKYFSKKEIQFDYFIFIDELSE